MKFMELVIKNHKIILKNKVGEMEVELVISAGIIFDYQKMITIKDNGKVLFEKAYETNLVEIPSLIEGSLTIGYDLTVIKNS